VDQPENSKVTPRQSPPGAPGARAAAALKGTDQGKKLAFGPRAPRRLYRGEEDRQSEFFHHAEGVKLPGCRERPLMLGDLRAPSCPSWSK
jgi:hypothetical protein